MSDTGRIVQKLWSFCNVLRDDGLSYLDYIEQLTCLLFLKMMDERAALTARSSRFPRAVAGLTSPTRRWKASGSKQSTVRSSPGWEPGA